jgi:hypothetical protein
MTDAQIAAIMKECFPKTIPTRAFFKFARLAADLQANNTDRLMQRKAVAYDEWIEKTKWVQQQISTFPVGSLGKHCADVMREEIERLRAAPVQQEPYGYAAEACDGHITFFKKRPTAFDGPQWKGLMTVHALSALPSLRSRLKAEEDYVSKHNDEQADNFASGLRSGLRIAIEITENAPAGITDELVLTPDQIIDAERRSNMTDDEALRFGRSIESMVLRILLSRSNAPQPKAAQPAKTISDPQINQVWLDFCDSKKSKADFADAVRTIAAQPAPTNNYHDAYRGARDDLQEWKKRALKAEESCRKMAQDLNEMNGPTHMGDPVLKAQPAPMLVASLPSEREMQIAQAIRQACGSCYSPDDSADDWHEKMGDIDLATIIAALPALPSQPVLSKQEERSYRPLCCKDTLGISCLQSCTRKDECNAAPCSADAKDAERLDFLERSMKEGKQFSFRKNLFFEAKFTSYEYDAFKTLREALDAAMQPNEQLRCDETPEEPTGGNRG